MSEPFKVGDTLRIQDYLNAGGFRVWKVVGVHLGAAKQEGTYALRPLDKSENKSIQVPCVILETHLGIELV